MVLPSPQNRIKRGKSHHHVTAALHGSPVEGGLTLNFNYLIHTVSRCYVNHAIDNLKNELAEHLPLVSHSLALPSNYSNNKNGQPDFQTLLSSQRSRDVMMTRKVR